MVRVQSGPLAGLMGRVTDVEGGTVTFEIDLIPGVAVQLSCEKVSLIDAIADPET